MTQDCWVLQYSIPAYSILYSHLDCNHQLSLQDLSKVVWAGLNPDKVKLSFTTLEEVPFHMKKSVKCFSEYTALVSEMWKVALCPLQSISSSGVPCHLGLYLCLSTGSRMTFFCLGPWGMACRAALISDPGPALGRWLLPWPPPPSSQPTFILPSPCHWDAGPLPKATSSCDGPSQSSAWHEVSLQALLLSLLSDQSPKLPHFCPQVSAPLFRRSFLLPLNFYPFSSLTQVELHPKTQGQASSAC